MITIPLTLGFSTVVDDVDSALAGYKWSASVCKKTGRVYAVRRVNRRTQSLHREILGLEYGNPIQGEHKDGDSLNNQRGNLRVASQGQNNLNRRLCKKNRSGFFGVSWNSGRRKWRAGLFVAKKYKNLGDFETAEKAALARDVAAVKFFGEFARLNFPTLTPDEILQSSSTHAVA